MYGTNQGSGLTESLIDRWEPILADGNGPAITTLHEAATMARVLETQAMVNSGQILTEASTLTPDMAQFQQYTLPLARRQIPALMAMNLCTSAPMTQPFGALYVHRFRYAPSAGGWANGIEAGYNTVLPNYAGKGTSAAPSGWATAEMELLGNTFLNSNNIYSSYSQAPADLGFTVEQIPVLAQGLAIRSQYTLELRQDYASVHGMDADQVVLEGLQTETQRQLDRQVLLRNRRAAALNGVPTIDISAPSADGRWGAEKIAMNIVGAILAAANQIAVTTQEGQGSWVVVTPDIATALQMLQNGIFTSVKVDVNATRSTTAVSKIGTLNGTIDVYRDHLSFGESYALVGYKGERPGSSAVTFMPYIPYIITRTTGPEDGSPRIIVKSRFALVDSAWGSANYVREIRFAGVGAVPGASGTIFAGNWNLRGNTLYAGS